MFTVANGEFPEQDNSLLKDIPKNLEVIKVPIKEPYVIYKLLTGRKKREDSCRISDRKEKEKLSSGFCRVGARQLFYSRCKDVMDQTFGEGIAAVVKYQYR